MYLNIQICRDTPSSKELFCARLIREARHTKKYVIQGTPKINRFTNRPRNCMFLPIAQVKNVDKQMQELNFCSANDVIQHTPKRARAFFLQGGREGRSLHASIGLEPNVFLKHYYGPIKMAPSKKAKKNFGRTSQLINKKMNIHPLFTLPICTHAIRQWYQPRLKNRFRTIIFMQLMRRLNMHEEGRNFPFWV